MMIMVNGVPDQCMHHQFDGHCLFMTLGRSRLINSILEQNRYRLGVFRYRIVQTSNISIPTLESLTKLPDNGLIKLSDNTILQRC